MGAILGFLLKLGLGGMVDRALDSLDRRAELANDREALRAKTTAELARLAVEEARVMEGFNRAKLNHWPFWVLVWAVALPFIAWEWSVVIDSIPYLRDAFGEQQVANLPTPELRLAFAKMIEWTFYTGATVAGGVAAFRMLRR